ncbi:hypothetical protein KEJ39_00930 [Candidatus Bathyarchaeota archaeon]|nr:hypothetical protein [Candidatus Bathyarchaeota archaeon]
MVGKAEFDEGRAVVDVRRIVGKEIILPTASLRTDILLRHNQTYTATIEETTPSEATHAYWQKTPERKLSHGFPSAPSDASGSIP